MSEPSFSGSTGTVWRLHEVCVLLAAPRELVLELVDYHSAGKVPEEFDRQWLQWLGRSLRLQRDLGVDALAAAFIADLLDQNAALERRLRLLERLAGLASD